MKTKTALAAILTLSALSLIPSANSQEWVGGSGSGWSTTNNWSPSTVPDGRDVTVVFADDANTPVIGNTGQGFTTCK